MVVGWALVLVVSIIGASLASRRAVTSALQITEALHVSPALVGVTVMAIGTDLPEIANSLMASASGHGDLNVGDSMGSVMTQVTLVLGLLCLAGRNIQIDRNFVISTGLATVFASAAVWLLVDDNDLSHLDGLILLLLWIAGTALLGQEELRIPRRAVKPRGRVAAHVVSTLFWLAVVGAFSIGIVQSFLQVLERFGLPEFVASFVVLSIGTSLPELVVDWTAIRRGVSALAVGDLFGSSFVDATLSIGIGPLVFGAALSGDVTLGVTVAAIAVLAATLFTARARRYDWRLGAALIALYIAAQTIVATATP
jgi:cation:H+ antiporter